MTRTDAFRRVARYRCVGMCMLCALYLVAVSGVFAQETVALREVLVEAQELFQEASNLEEAQTAEQLYTQALRRYEYALDEAGVRNARLLYNIGNGYFRIGDMGNAVLHYRRAQRLAPADGNIAHNLEYARAQRSDLLPSPPRERFSRTVFFWHHLVPPPLKAPVVAVCFAAAWIGATVYLLQRKRWQLLGVVAAGLLTVAFAGSLLADELGFGVRHDGVITAKEVVARKGDGTAYQKSFVDPLHGGTEFARIEERGEWMRIRLTDGRTGWIPSESGTMVLR